MYTVQISILHTTTAFPRPTPVCVDLHLWESKGIWKQAVVCWQMAHAVSKTSSQTTSPTRRELGGAVLKMAIAICALATDAADNTEATCVTSCFIHKADCNALCRVLVRVCQHCGNWLIFFASSSCKLTLTYWSSKPHSVSLISLPLCLSVTPSCLSVRLLPSLLLSAFTPASLSLGTLPTVVKREHEKRWANMPTASEFIFKPNVFPSSPHSCLPATCNIPSPLRPHRIRLKLEMCCFPHSVKSKSNWVNLSGFYLLGSSRD